MTVSDEAVEAAARFISDCVGTGAGNWEWHVDGARELLAEVAPFIAAQAWDEGEHAGYMNRSAEERHGIEPHTNPYRSEQ